MHPERNIRHPRNGAPRRLPPLPARVRDAFGDALVDDKTIRFVTATPFDVDAERDVSFATGRAPVVTLACRSTVQAALERYYADRDQVRLTPGDTAVRLRPADTDVRLKPDTTRTSDAATRKSVLIADDEPITRTLVKLYTSATAIR